MKSNVMPANSVSIKAEESEAFSDWIDEVADRFEDAWRGGGFPRIADFLGEAAGERRLALLQELIEIDVYWRHRQGADRAADDYVREFPELAGPDSPVPLIVGRYVHEDAGSAP